MQGGTDPDMEGGNCVRHLWPTLVAAASTFGLFAAANWGLAGLVGSPLTPSALLAGRTSPFLAQWALFLLHFMFAFTMPVLPFIIAMRNVLDVWRMKARLALRRTESQNVSSQLDHETIAAMTTCPMFIEIPAEAQHRSVELMNRRYPIISTLDGFIPPAELRPAPRPQEDQNPRTGREANSPTEAPAVSHNDEVHNANSSAAGGGSEIRDQSADSAGISGVHVPEKRYIPLSGMPRSVELRERETLLALGLVPEKRELGFLRSRGVVLSVVTILQASGYTLGVLERLVDHAAISPLEAILTFLCVIVILQMLMELYASGTYRRPLLLSLNDQEFSRFLNEPGVIGRPAVPRISRSSRYMVLAVPVVMASPFLYTALFFLHHSQYMCSLSVFLFFLIPLSTVLLVTFLTAAPDYPFDSAATSLQGGAFSAAHSSPYLLRIRALLLLTLISWALFIVSAVVAVVATAKHRELFQKPSRDIFQWILPHVAA